MDYDYEGIQDRKNISAEFGNGKLNVPSLWVIKLKDGTQIKDWATSHQEVRRGLADARIESIHREHIRFGDPEPTHSITTTLDDDPED